ncbi:hypothetical protein V1514DRAFT_189010 [Lipomyces japonicus]|uniref:uncharacterized protein n=1 Tax=Lipomyces japonicus TaxID=56871 RepID=UPI0034CD3A19
MSLALLRQRRDYTHSAVDDLESVFWVLLWLCTHYQEGGEKVTNERSLEKYKTWQHMDLIAFSDKLDIISNRNAFNLVLEDFDPYYFPLKNVVTELRGLFFPYGSTDTTLRPIEQELYDRVINCLRDASRRLT